MNLSLSPGQVAHLEACIHFQQGESAPKPYIGLVKRKVLVSYHCFFEICNPTFTALLHLLEVQRCSIGVLSVLRSEEVHDTSPESLILSSKPRQAKKKNERQPMETDPEFGVWTQKENTNT